MPDALPRTLSVDPLKCPFCGKPGTDQVLHIAAIDVRHIHLYEPRKNRVVWEGYGEVIDPPITSHIPDQLHCLHCGKDRDVPDEIKQSYE